MKFNLVKEFDFQQSIKIVDSRESRLWTLGDHLTNIANKKCLTLDFCKAYCSQNIYPYKDFEFLNFFQQEIENSTLLVDFTFAPYIEYNDFISYRNLLRTQCPSAVFVTADFKYLNDPGHVFYSGIFYCQYKKWTEFYPTALDMSMVSQRDYYVSCLNRRPLNHRAYLIAKLYNQGFVNNKNYITFYNRNPYTNDLITEHDYYIQQLPELTKKEFIDLIPLLPFNHDLNYSGQNDVSFNHDAYSNSYLNIVTESEVECRWFSEKVMKPLATGQLFLLAAGQQAVNDLRELGFDVFDDIIDHSRYDSLANWTDRLDTIISMLHEYQNLNWKEIYKETLIRRQKNIHYFFSESFQNKIRQNIKSVVT